MHLLLALLRILLKRRGPDSRPQARAQCRDCGSLFVRPADSAVTLCSRCRERHRRG